MSDAAGVIGRPLSITTVRSDHALARRRRARAELEGDRVEPLEQEEEHQREPVAEGAEQGEEEKRDAEEDEPDRGVDQVGVEARHDAGRPQPEGDAFRRLGGVARVEPALGDGRRRRHVRAATPGGRNSGGDDDRVGDVVVQAASRCAEDQQDVEQAVDRSDHRNRREHAGGEVAQADDARRTTPASRRCGRCGSSAAPCRRSGRGSRSGSRG